jgi:hypothetical protein
MNTKEWKFKADGLISQWESDNFKIEIEFDSFLYKLAQEEQQEMYETSALFQTRLNRNKEKINEFQPLSLSQILSPDKDSITTPRSIYNSNVNSDQSAKMTSIKSKKKPKIHSRSSPNRFLKSLGPQDKTFIIDDSSNYQISTVKTQNEAPLKLPIKKAQKKRGGWFCLGLNFCMGQPDDGSEVLGERLTGSRVSQSCLAGEYINHRLTETAWSDFRCSRGFFGPDDSLRLVEKTNFNSMIIERTEACENGLMEEPGVIRESSESRGGIVERGELSTFPVKMLEYNFEQREFVQPQGVIPEIRPMGRENSYPNNVRSNCSIF